MKKISITPIFLSIVFFNTFVDLGHKIIIQNSFYITSTPDHYTIMAAIINAMILLPYIVMFMPAGFIADKFSKTNVMRYTALAAVPLTVFITIFYYAGLFWPAFAMTLLLGIQSALNSPSKYGFIKEHFGNERLSKINGIVQAIVIVAIMAGTFLFSVLFQYFFPNVNWSETLAISKAHIVQTIAPVGFLLIIGSSLEAWLTWRLPVYTASDAKAPFNWQQYFKFTKEKEFLKLAYSDTTIWAAIIGLAALWSIGQVLLANYGAFLKEHVANPSPSFVNGTIGLGSIGILFGAIYAGRVSKNYIETGLIPLGAMGVTLSLLFLPHVTNKITIPFLFLIFGYFSGLLMVPLNALIQYNSSSKNLGKILSANNFIQNVAMISCLVIVAFLAKEKVNTMMMMYGLLGLAIVGCGYAIWRLPQSLLRYLVYLFISKFYRISVQGFDHIPAKGGALLLGNHTSFLDWAIIQIASPRPVRFVIERSIYQRWYLHWILKHLKMVPISKSASKDAISEVGAAIDAGVIVVLFPEGFITRNGHVGNFQRGFELIVKEHPCPIIPFYLHGLWGTMTSYAKRRSLKSTRGHLRRVSITFGDMITKPIDAAELKRVVMNLSYTTWDHYAKQLPTIQHLWLQRAKQMKSSVAIVDGERTVSGYQGIVLNWALQKALKAKINQDTSIGLLLPPSLGGILSNLALLSAGKSVVNLNYTASPQALSHMLTKASIKTIITSKLFIKRVQGKGFLPEAILQTVHLIYLEDIFASLSKAKLVLKSIWVRCLPAWSLQYIINKHTDPSQTAAILFSSGSEGLPKGVELSHHNIISNIKQMTYSLNIDDNDKLLNCLPLFHAMGLTITSLLPLLEGIPVVCYADPTDALGVAKAICQHKVTILCSTQTMFNLYVRNKKCHPLMLQSVRVALSGAEKLLDSTYQGFKEKFNVNILEGYGTTENSPVVSCNLPDILIPEYWHIQMGEKKGSVGMPMPGTRVKVIDPITHQELSLGEAGLLVISGPQLMLGYLDEPEKNKNAFILLNEERWYNTGDKGYLDEEGFIYIVDRYSRFAKIGGEMVSLTSVENNLRNHLDETVECIAINVPDDKKGERIVLLHNAQDVDFSAIQKAMLQAGINSLLLPSEYCYSSDIPKLGTGKLDFSMAKKRFLQGMNHEQSST